MRVLVCGSRDWLDYSNHELIQSLIRGIYYQRGKYTLVQGGCEGADRTARVTAPADVTVKTYPADWDTHGRAAGPLRNQQMLDEGTPDLVLAFVNKPLEESRGTNDMVTRAKKAGVPTYVIERVS